MERRPLVKVKLTDNTEAWDAFSIVAEWRRARQAATHIPRAIRLYAALLRRDTSALEQYFPWLLDAVGNRTTSGSTRRISAAQEPIKVTYKERSAEEDEDDLLSSVGLDGLEFD